MSAGGLGMGTGCRAAQKSMAVRCARGLTAWPWPGPAWPCPMSLRRRRSCSGRRRGGGRVGWSGWGGAAVGGGGAT